MSFRLSWCVLGAALAVALSGADPSAAQAGNREEPGDSPAPSTVEAGPGEPGKPRVFYVRQTIGDDANDGLSPEKAWQSLSRLESAMQPGDTAYVGPGLYRETITVANSGTAEDRITFIADSTGRHTTDPPGVVMITGADPVDETTFVPGATPGVYTAPHSEGRVWGVVEMDGPQYRYVNAFDTTEHLRDSISEPDVVVGRPSSFFYDLGTKVLSIHTSDDKPPSSHEIELIRRSFGIVAYEKHYISVIGFTFRHMGNAGINFGKGSSNGIVLNNISYGAWQGIRVSDSTDVLVAGNTSFRNDNSGIYFLGASRHGYAIGNTLYENAKGARWGSDSANGLALDNVAYANRETGISIEESDDIRLSGNLLVDNAVSQLRVRKSRYTSDANCFESAAGEQLIAEIYYAKRYRTLAEYQHEVNQDHGSREGCGALPERLDVHELHATTLVYSERARELMAADSRREPGPRR